MKLKGYTARNVKKGTRVLMRIDANVPMNGTKILEGPLGRLARTAPEIKKLADRGAKVILISHFGRPGGRHDSKLTLKPIATRMSKLVGKKVQFIPGIDHAKVVSQLEGMRDGSVVMLENLRFDAREKKNDTSFAKLLASYADVYINNAFGVCHRKHASVNAVTRYLPSYAGKLLQKEITELSKTFHKPFILVMGGVKLKTKIPVILKLAPKASAVLLGGGISLPMISVGTKTPLQLKGRAISREELSLARQVLKKFGAKIILPIDLKVRINRKEKLREVAARDLKKSHQVVDIGMHTQELYRRMVIGAKSVAWNGAMGIVEEKEGAEGTVAVANAIARLKGARTILGGGDTVAFVERLGIGKKFTLLSTGGGAMLAYLAGESLPGLEPLTDHH